MPEELLALAESLALQSDSEKRRLPRGLTKRLDHYQQVLRQASATAQESASRSELDAWLSDNFRYLRSLIQEVRLSMPKGYYRELPCLKAGPQAGSPRIQVLCATLVSHTNAQVDLQVIADFLNAYQQNVHLSLAELWAINSMVKLSLFEKLCHNLTPAADGSARNDLAIKNSITSLRALENASWKEFVESVSVIERILQQDPSGIYSQQDFNTRDLYRQAVETIARRSRRNEEKIAELAIEEARRAGLEGARPIERHVGYHIFGPGTAAFRKKVGCSFFSFAEAHLPIVRLPNLFYLGGLFVLTILFTALAWRYIDPVSYWTLALLILPASIPATALLNLLISYLVPARRLARLDFSEGVPSEYRAVVVVPTLFISRSEVEKLLKDLEIRFLANKDQSISWALLTDFPDSATPDDQPDELLALCAEGIQSLNRTYSDEHFSPFYLFHRPRKWNPSQDVWMGHERKRGKIVDFNELVLGQGDAFDTKIGDLSVLPNVRYIITLDSDTQMPGDSARKLIETMAHPLNRPVIDPVTNTVREGFTILLPRIATSMQSVVRSRLARLKGGETGFDPYTSAISDVYQDLYDRGSFVGKGIYDVRAFQQAVGRRFPENSLLSHDLIEGEYCRTALATDLEMIDDCPAAYEAWCKRKHRWVRGDWQIVSWLFNKVPGPDGFKIENPLPLISRWKIFDNLRRSLLELSLLIFLLVGWFIEPDSTFEYTMVALGFLIAPVWFDFIFALIRIPNLQQLRSSLRLALFRLVKSHLEVLVDLIFLPHQALLMADAVVRTFVRRYFTKKNLLEWQTMAQAEMGSAQTISLVQIYLFLSPVIALIAFFLVNGIGEGHPLATLVVELWLLSPLAALWLDRPPAKPKPLTDQDRTFLRDVSLQTWRYFTDFYSAEDNWLIPDNVQEDPPIVAHRLSPTNLGLMMTANLAAVDFGYLTPTEFAGRLEKMCESARRLERYRGHFYNWYDTRSLETLSPRYVSAVDSGNLVASLLTIKQGCFELLDKPIIHQSVLEGLRDHCVHLRDILPASTRSAAMMRLFESLLKTFEYRPTDLFFWEGILDDTQETATRLSKHIDLLQQRENGNLLSDTSEWIYWKDRFMGRIQSARQNLATLAPWLKSPYEQQLRIISRNPAFANLFSKLNETPALNRLPGRYDEISAEIDQCLNSFSNLHSTNKEVLTGLQSELPAAREEACRLIQQLKNQAQFVAKTAEEHDFAFLFNPQRKLLRVGVEPDSGTVDASHYDLLASEARTAVFLAIAVGDAPRDAWFRLGRKLVSYAGERTLVAWSGTMFEYLMPCLYMHIYENTLIAQSVESAVKVQRYYAREKLLPWGISEAAHSARDEAQQYQYRAFGIPELALDRALPEGVVIAPYATMLALLIDPHGATENLRSLAGRDWMGKYGFYESIDFRQRGVFTKRRGIVVRSFMVHHQAMGLLALNNALLDGPMQERFHTEPLVMSAEFLLQERAPAL